MKINLVSAKKSDGRLVAKISASSKSKNRTVHEDKYIMPLAEVKTIDWSAKRSVDVCVRERDTFLLMKIGKSCVARREEETSSCYPPTHVNFSFVCSWLRTKHRSRR